MLSELLAILFKNMIPINNFQLMVLEQNYQTGKESFQKCTTEQKWKVIWTVNFRISGTVHFIRSLKYPTEHAMS